MMQNKSLLLIMAATLFYAGPAQSETKHIYLLNPVPAIRPGVVFDASAETVKGGCIAGSLQHGPQKNGVEHDTGRTFIGGSAEAGIESAGIGSAGGHAGGQNQRRWFVRWKNDWPESIENYKYAPECSFFNYQNLINDNNLYYVIAVHKADEVEFIYGAENLVAASIQGRLSDAIPFGAKIDVSAQSGGEQFKMGHLRNVYFKIVISNDWPREQELRCDFNQMCWSLLRSDFRFFVKREDRGVVVIFPSTPDTAQMNYCMTELRPGSNAPGCTQHLLYTSGNIIDLKRDDSTLRVEFIRENPSTVTLKAELIPCRSYWFFSSC